MKRYVIERDIPAVGKLTPAQLQEAAQHSNAVLRDLGTDIQWQHSYRTANKLYCIYLAENEALVRRHAELSGFVASRVSQCDTIIDPTTAAGCG